MLQIFFPLLFILMDLALGANHAHGQEKIRIAWAGASPANAAVWVLQEKKLMQKYGVEPEIISINASPIVLQALLAGEIDISAISVAALVADAAVPARACASSR